MARGDYFPVSTNRNQSHLAPAAKTPRRRILRILRDQQAGGRSVLDKSREVDRRRHSWCVIPIGAQSKGAEYLFLVGSHR